MFEFIFRKKMGVLKSIFSLIAVIAFPTIIMSAAIGPGLAEPDTFYFDVENGSMGELYFIIFNAIAVFFDTSSSNNDYYRLLRLTFMLGGMFVFMGAVGKTLMGQGSHQGIFDFFKYLITGTALLMLVFGNKATIAFESSQVLTSYCDSANTVPDYTVFDVANMPLLLAATFSGMNQVGNTLNNMTRSAFSTTDVGQVINGNSEYASYLTSINSILTTPINAMLDTNSTTGNFSSPGSDYDGISARQALGPYFRLFMKDCVLMLNATDAGIATKIQEALDSTSYFSLTLEQLFSGPNLITSYDGLKVEKYPSVTAALSTGGTAASQIFNVQGQSGTCGQFYTDIIGPSIASLDNDSLFCSPALKGKVDPGGMYILTGKTNLPKGDAAEIAINSGIFQMYGDIKNGGYVAEDISFASGRTRADFVMNNVGSGMYMAEMLPYLQMGIRAVLYAFFPFIFVVMLLPGGIGVLISYLQTMIWVELWTPVASVLNLFLAISAHQKFSNAFDQEGFNPGSSLNILQDSSIMASIGGYLYASVPALTWLVLKGSGQMLGSITGGMSAGFSSNMASKSINEASASMAKRDQVNDFSASETGKFLSMAEVEQSQAVGQGMSEGAKFGTMMMAAGGTAAGAMGVMTSGGVGDGHDAIKKGTHADNTSSYDAKAGGIATAAQTKSTTVAALAKGMIGQDGKVDQGRLKQIADVEGYSSTQEYLKTEKYQEMMQKQFGMDKGQATEFASKIQAQNTVSSEQDTNKHNQKTGGVFGNLRSDTSSNTVKKTAGSQKRDLEDFVTMGNAGYTQTLASNIPVKGTVAAINEMGEENVQKAVNFATTKGHSASESEKRQFLRGLGVKENDIDNVNSAIAGYVAGHTQGVKVGDEGASVNLHQSNTDTTDRVHSQITDLDNKTNSTKDSFNLTKSSLENKLSREVTDKEVRDVMAMSRGAEDSATAQELMAISNPTNIDEKSLQEAGEVVSEISATGKSTHKTDTYNKAVQTAKVAKQELIDNVKDLGDSPETLEKAKELEKVEKDLSVSKEKYQHYQGKQSDPTRKYDDKDKERHEKYTQQVKDGIEKRDNLREEVASSRENDEGRKERKIEELKSIDLNDPEEVVKLASSFSSKTVDVTTSGEDGVTTTSYNTNRTGDNIKEVASSTRKGTSVDTSINDDIAKAVNMGINSDNSFVKEVKGYLKENGMDSSEVTAKDVGSFLSQTDKYNKAISTGTVAGMAFRSSIKATGQVTGKVIKGVSTASEATTNLAISGWKKLN